MPRTKGSKNVAKNIKDFLSSPATKKLFDEGKAQVQEGGGGFAEFDDGKYRGQIVSATMGRSQASGRWQHVMAVKFLEGEYKGQSCYQYQGLENAMGFTMLAAQFAKLGIELDSPDDLEVADKQVMKEKPVVEFRLRTKGEFQNLLVLKVAEEENEEDVDSDEDEDDEVEAVEEDEDDAEEAEEKPSKKSKPAEDDEDSEDDDEEEEDEDSEDEEDEEDEEEKPKSKKTSKKIVEKDEDDSEEDDEDEDSEDEEEKDEEEKVTLDVGTKVKIKYEDENVVGKIVKVDEDKSRIKVKLKSGDKVWVSVPDDVVDVLA